MRWFIGSAVLRAASPGLVLAGVSLAAIALISLSTQTTGALSGYSLLAIGLMNAIMFPTIFTLACEKLGPRAADATASPAAALILLALFVAELARSRTVSSKPGLDASWTDCFPSCGFDGGDPPPNLVL